MFQADGLAALQRAGVAGDPPQTYRVDLPVLAWPVLDVESC